MKGSGGGAGGVGVRAAQLPHGLGEQSKDAGPMARVPSSSARWHEVPQHSPRGWSLPPTEPHPPRDTVRLTFTL